MKNKHPFKVGDAVVYKAPNGDSISATVSSVHYSSRGKSDNDCVYIDWYPSYAQKHTRMILRKDWGSLVPFGAASFLVLS